jgi:hypothetical protein
MTANERPRDVLWIEVPATSSAEDLARVIDAFPPGTEGRYYLVHMDLMAGRVDFVDTLTQRGYQVNISDILRQYAFGTQKEHFAVFWLGDDRTPGETANPAVHLIPDERGLPPAHLRTGAVSAEVTRAEYDQEQRVSS